MQIVMLEDYVPPFGMQKKQINKKIGTHAERRTGEKNEKRRKCDRISLSGRRLH